MHIQEVTTHDRTLQFFIQQFTLTRSSHVILSSVTTSGSDGPKPTIQPFRSKLHAQ